MKNQTNENENELTFWTWDSWQSLVGAEGRCLAGWSNSDSLWRTSARAATPPLSPGKSGQPAEGDYRIGDWGRTPEKK